MIYVIDHQDSFTFNLVHLLSLFDKVHVTNYFEIDFKKLNQSNLIVFSPGENLIFNKEKLALLGTGGRESLYVL